MALYCGIDLHSNNHYVVVIDDNDRRLVERKLSNDVALTLKLLEPYRAELHAVVVESTFNWYWLVDGLMAAGLAVKLANTAAMSKYDELKHTDDRHDAFWLAKQLRLGILPTGYIYPREARSLRDLLRKRMSLVQTRAKALTSLQNLYHRESGGRQRTDRLQRKEYSPAFADPYVQRAAEASTRVVRVLSQEINALERDILAALKENDAFKRLCKIPGIGRILAFTVLLEVGDIRRFPSAGDFASYCRCVSSTRLSNGKKKGEGNSKSGNKWLSWAFSEAAHFFYRYEPRARQFVERKKRKTNGIVAIRALAHKLARAVYHVLHDGVEFDASRMFR